nr:MULTISPECIES: cation:dicarboxylase symporter family transporter [unclassified Amycolatopsis]
MTGIAAVGDLRAVGRIGLKAVYFGVVTTFALLFTLVLAAISRCYAGVSVWKFLRYAREEFLLALGTASTESVMPRIMAKLTDAGCSRAATGLARPAAAGGTDPDADVEGHGGPGLLLGADRLMDSMRVFVNLLGNCVATFVVAKSEGQLDRAELRETLEGATPVAA